MTFQRTISTFVSFLPFRLAGTPRGGDLTAFLGGRAERGRDDAGGKVQRLPSGGQRWRLSEGIGGQSYFLALDWWVGGSQTHTIIPCRGFLLHLLASAVWPSRLPKVVINGTLVALPLNLSHYMSLVVDKFLEGGGRGSEGRTRAACASSSRQGRRKRTDLSSPWRFCGCFHSSLRKITIISNLGLPLILAEPVDFHLREWISLN